MIIWIVHILVSFIYGITFEEDSINVLAGMSFFELVIEVTVAVSAIGCLIEKKWGK